MRDRVGQQVEDEFMTVDDQLRIEAACRRLQTAFAVHLDHRRYDQVLALFTEDAEYSPRGIAYRGHEEILGVLKGRPADRTSRHVITNQLVDLTDARRAAGYCTMIYYVHEGPGTEPLPLPGPCLVGDYHDEFLLTPAGWRIARRIGRIVFDAGK